MNHPPNAKHLFRFNEKNYHEAYEMLCNARAYFMDHGATEKKQLTSKQNVVYTLAMSTITTRLSSAIAWLLTCKAVQHQEITLHDMLKDEFKLQRYDLKINTNDPMYHFLSQPIQDMLASSEQLYQRIKRIEHTIHQSITQSAPPYNAPWGHSHEN